MLIITEKEYNILHKDFKGILEMDFIWKDKNYKGSKAMMKFIEGEGTALIVEGIGFKIVPDDYYELRFGNNEIAYDIHQFTKEQAVIIFDSEEWKTWSKMNILKFQLFQSSVCLDFDLFQNAIKEILLLDPNPWNLNKDTLIPRYLNVMKFPKPTTKDLLNLLSEDLIQKLTK